LTIKRRSCVSPSCSCAALQFHSISAIVDLHGHSHKEGIFLYGCLPDKRLLRINPPILAIGGSGGNSTNADESSSYKDNSKLSTVVGGSGQGQQAGPNERTTSQGTIAMARNNHATNIQYSTPILNINAFLLR